MFLLILSRIWLLQRCERFFGVFWPFACVIFGVVSCIFLSFSRANNFVGHFPFAFSVNSMQFPINFMCDFQLILCVGDFLKSFFHHFDYCFRVLQCDSWANQISIAVSSKWTFNCNYLTIQRTKCEMGGRAAGIYSYGNGYISGSKLEIFFFCSSTFSLFFTTFFCYY